MSEFIIYLCNNKIQHIAIQLNELIEYISIYDNVLQNEELSYWVIDGNKIYLKDIETIYHFIPRFDDDIFKTFVSYDQNYAKCEYYAYLLYRLTCFRKTVNPVSPILTVTSERSLPAIYKYAKSVNIIVPKYCVSGSSTVLTKFMSMFPVISSEDLFSYQDLIVRKKVSEKDLMLAEKINGAPVIVHLFKKRILSTIIYREGKKIFDLSNELIESCYKLAEKFRLAVAELYFIRTLDNQFVFYYISGLPNYSISAHGHNIIFENLNQQLQSPLH